MASAEDDAEQPALLQDEGFKPPTPCERCRNLNRLLTDERKDSHALREQLKNAKGHASEVSRISRLTYGKDGLATSVAIVVNKVLTILENTKRLSRQKVSAMRPELVAMATEEFRMPKATRRTTKFKTREPDEHRMPRHGKYSS